MPTHVLGRLVGNTGDPTNLSMVLNSSFAGRRGEFVRVRHREQEGAAQTDVLARIVSISRSNVLYNSGLGQAVTELELLPGAHVTGEQILGKLEAIGYRDPTVADQDAPPGARSGLAGRASGLPVPERVLRVPGALEPAHRQSRRLRARRFGRAGVPGREPPRD
jgi:hypothetical protein